MSRTQRLLAESFRRACSASGTEFSCSVTDKLDAARAAFVTDPSIRGTRHRSRRLPCWRRNTPKGVRRLPQHGLRQRIAAACLRAVHDESDQVKALCLQTVVRLVPAQVVSRDEVIATGLKHLWSVSAPLQLAAISAAALSKEASVGRELLLLSRSQRETARKSVESLVAWREQLHERRV